jgi:vancomycin aglycone glucosyltransferase
LVNDVPLVPDIPGAMLPRGWANLALIDDQLGCISISEVNQQSLFSQVAAVVHRVGTGTTSAARAGVPQVIIPQVFDQPYIADRVQQLESRNGAHRRPNDGQPAW